MRSRLSVAVAFVYLATALQATSTDSAIIDAARRGAADEVRRLLKEGANVNTATGDGMTALHWAAQNGNVGLAELLLRAGANVRAATRLGAYTPLLLASSQRETAMVESLLKAGADANRANANGTTPLMLAARAGKVEAVVALIAAGADLNAKESAKDQTALAFAAATGRADVIRALAARGASTAATTRAVDLSTFVPAVRYRAGAGRGGGGSGDRPRPSGPPAVPGVSRAYTYAELVGYWGGLAPLHLAARQGYVDAVDALLETGVDINQRSQGNGITALLIAAINGHFDLAGRLLEKGADPNLTALNGVGPLYAVLNCQWAPKSYYPQPRAQEQQRTTYLDLATALLDAGADPNARLTRKVWYSHYNIDHSSLDETGSTPFWRAAYAADVEAMKLLVAHGADPHIPTIRPPGRVRVFAAESGSGREQEAAVPVGGPGVTALHAASGVGYGQGPWANHHRFAPTGMLPAVKYLVDELGLDVNARDHDANTAVHNAASRGDNEMIRYLVSQGADVTFVNNAGQTTVDMANGPVQRIQPFPETIRLLESLGAKNNHRCVSC